MAEAVFDFFLPYQCPADCALSQYDQIREPVADDAAAIELAGGLNYTTTCVEAMMCDDFSPSGTQSPLKYEADRNALIFLVIAGLHFASIYLKMCVPSVPWPSVTFRSITIFRHDLPLDRGAPLRPGHDAICPSVALPAVATGTMPQA